jgi:hypothetical protein
VRGRPSKTSTIYILCYTHAIQVHSLDACICLLHDVYVYVYVYVHVYVYVYMYVYLFTTRSVVNKYKNIHVFVHVFVYYTIVNKYKYTIVNKYKCIHVTHVFVYYTSIVFVYYTQDARRARILKTSTVTICSSKTSRSTTVWQRFRV